MTFPIPTDLVHGAELIVPLNRLKKSPRNARRVPHTQAAIEALAASIGAKGVLQAPVVEPERDEKGVPTGYFLVTIGEGRRQALRLRAQRKAIKKTEPVKVVVDLDNDAHEISLDENVTRSDMHPADQFEAFRDLAERRGLSAEEIGARFGVSAHVVRQRLRLGAISPKLMDLYRAEELTLDQLMAFAVSDDHARQEQVLEQLNWNRSTHLIRRAMTELKVQAQDRRAVFVGVEAYTEAGGTILRDLFTEDDGGWFEDVGLLDRLTVEKLATLANQVRSDEGWKWSEAYLDYPHTLGLARVYPRAGERSEVDTAAMAALAEEYDTLVSQWDSAEALPAEIEARFAEIDTALQAFGDGYAYDPGEVARGGVFVVLGYDGQARFERGLVRAEDLPALPEPVADDAADPEAEIEEAHEAADGEELGEPGAPLPDRLILDLTAHRSMALRDALARAPAEALRALVHSLTLFAFYPPYERASCVEIKGVSAYLEGHAPGLADSPAGRAVAERHEAWAMRLPKSAADAWAAIQALAETDLLDLMAHCVGLTVNAVHAAVDRRPVAWAHADALAANLGLDMNAYWTPTSAAFFSRITKAQIADAVRDAVSNEASERLAGLKKEAMAEAAASAVAGTGWLPPLLRTAGVDVVDDASSVTGTELDSASVYHA